VIRRCATPGCGILTLGKLCLSCEQKTAAAPASFPRGRPYVPPATRPPASYADTRKAAKPSA
jgi:hypothetical protein